MKYLLAGSLFASLHGSDYLKIGAVVLGVIILVKGMGAHPTDPSQDKKMQMPKIPRGGGSSSTVTDTTETTDTTEE